MKKIEIKHNENKIKMPKPGIFVNGYIINATLYNRSKNDVLYTITNNTTNTTVLKKEK